MEDITIAVGETIRKIQKMKNIKIRNIYEGHFSESTYYRIINGEIETSIVTFNHILNQLHVTYDEFFHICKQHNYGRNIDYLSKIEWASLKQSRFELTDILQNLSEENISTEIIHLQHLCDLLIKKIDKVNIRVDDNPLIEYLINLDEWTRYELKLFNSCIFVFDLEFVNLLSCNLYKKYKNNSLYKEYEVEIFRLLINTVVINTQNFYFEKARKVFCLARRIDLPEDSLFERNLALFWSGFFEIRDGYSAGETKIKNSLAVFQLLKSETFYIMYKRIYMVIR